MSKSKVRGEPRPPTLEAHWDHEPGRSAGLQSGSTRSSFHRAASECGAPVHRKVECALANRPSGAGCLLRSVARASASVHGRRPHERDECRERRAGLSSEDRLSLPLCAEHPAQRCQSLQEPGRRRSGHRSPFAEVVLAETMAADVKRNLRRCATAPLRFHEINSMLETPPSPSPRPSPQGRGRIVGRYWIGAEPPGLSNDSMRGSLSPRERAGVRGKGTMGFARCLSSTRATRVAGAGLILLAIAGVVLLAGCTSAHYRRSADKDTYQIVQQVEARLFGKTNAFTIETPYSHRKPTDILPPELIEDRLQTNRRLLTLEEALNLAFTRSRAYQMQKETLYLTALSLTGAKHAFSPQFFASSDAKINRVANDVDVLRKEVTSGPSGPVTNVTVATETQVKAVGTAHSQVRVRQLLKSGGSLRVTLANDIVNDLVLYYNGDPQRSIVSTISVNLVQPLLRGFGRNHPAVEALTQAERNVVYAVRNHSFFQDQFSLAIVNDYFTLLAQKDTIRNRYA